MSSVLITKEKESLGIHPRPNFISKLAKSPELFSNSHITSERIFQNSRLRITCLDLIFNKISASSWKPEERTVSAKKSYDINRFYIYDRHNQGQKKRKIWSQPPLMPKQNTWSKISGTFFFSLLYPLFLFHSSR